MILTRQNGLEFYRFEHFSAFPELVHGIFGRGGGISPPPFDSLNISHGIGDSAANVEANRRCISETLGMPRLIWVSQVHGTRVLLVHDDHPDTDTSGPWEADALATRGVGKLLGIQTADCQAVMMYDPVQRVIVNVHAGWRGSIANILGRTLKRVTESFGCNPADFLVGVGPSLGPCCAEFINYRQEFPEIFWPDRNTKDHFDFWAISRDQLIGAGVLADNILVSGICTRCHTDQFFSFRAANVTGRFSAVIGLRES
jgi:purine-nucleoside/S-methyl-5'-thioadenosine phosphorylase / adenosine deaminase